MAVVLRRDARAAARVSCRAAALLAAVGLLAGATTACSPARRAERRSIAAASAGDETRTLTAGGRQRTFLLHRPAGKSDDAARLPTVLVFHGGGGNPAQMEAPVGRQSEQISATDVITAFFAADLARK
jgi:acetyl esterase/lipase